VVGLEDGPIDEQHDAGGEEHTESCAARPSRAPALRHRGQDRTGQDTGAGRPEMGRLLPPLAVLLDALAKCRQSMKGGGRSASSSCVFSVHCVPFGPYIYCAVVIWSCEMLGRELIPS